MNNNNITLLKDIYQITRQLFDFEFEDKQIAHLFEFRCFKDGIKYIKGQNNMSIALVFGDNTFLGIITPFGRFEYKLALIYQKEFINNLVKKAELLFDATEISTPKNYFSSIVWTNPRIFPLKKLPWKKESLPPFTFTNNENEQINQRDLEQIYNDWNMYIEKINPPVKKHSLERNIK